MKIKVLSSEQTTKDGRKYTSYFTPVKIMVVGEEEKGLQEKNMSVGFTKVAEKQLPVDFKRGIIDGDINHPFVWEITYDEDGKPQYPVAWVRSINSITPVKARKKNTCTFLVDEEDTEETNID